MDRIEVKNGRLVYADGQEVSLWGTGYYAAHYAIYARCRELGLDPRQETERDFEHLKRIGVDVCRIHLIDDDITTPEGDLIENDHLDLLDYTLHLCDRHGMRFFLCPISWWQGTRVLNKNGGFRNRFSDPGLLYHDDALTAQDRYLRQLLAHHNPYRGLTWAEDPLIAAIEIRNEPEYVSLNKLNLARGGFPPTVQKDTFAIHQEEAVYLYEKWSRWCEERGKRPDSSNYRSFTRDMIAEYIRRLGGAIHDAGYPGPIFYPYFGEWHIPGLADLLATIEGYDGITFNCYTRVTSESPVLFSQNRILPLAEMDMSVLRGPLMDKPKAVYECDPCCLSGILFPAMALKMREVGAQMSGQWCYQPLFMAAEGPPFGSGNYLNLVYTPANAVAFRIAREVFREWPLYQSLGELADDLLPGNDPNLWPKQRPPRLLLQDVIQAGSLTMLPRNDLAVWRRAGEFFHSNTTTLTLEAGRRPDHIFASGSSPYVTISDDAVYEIRLGSGRGELFLAPGIVPIRDSHTHDEQLKKRPVALLSERRRTIDLSGLGLRNLSVRDQAGGQDCVPDRSGAWHLKPGVYALAYSDEHGREGLLDT